MKDVMSLVTFAIVVLCFVVFLTRMKPLGTELAPNKPANCIMANSGTRGCGSERRWSYFTGDPIPQSISERPSVASSDPNAELKLPT